MQHNQLLEFDGFGVGKFKQPTCESLSSIQIMINVWKSLHNCYGIHCKQGAGQQLFLMSSFLFSLKWTFFNPPTFDTFFIQVDAPFETIRYCGFEWWNNCVQCWFPKWFWMVGQLIQNLVWIFPNGSTANTKPCLDTSKWWINGTTMCVQNQWAFLKVETVYQQEG